jgi:hypothetical protein
MWAEYVVVGIEKFLDEMDKETDLTLLGSEDARPERGEHTQDYYEAKNELRKRLREYRKEHKR